MANDYTQTDNYGLSLYGDQSPADFRDGHNNNMRIIDQQLKTTNDATAKGTSAKNILDHIGWTDNDKAADWINNAEQNETQTTANTNALTALNAENTEKATALTNKISNAERMAFNQLVGENNIEIVIGDSIAQGYLAGSKRFSTHLADWYKLTEKNYAVGGAGWFAKASDTLRIQANRAISDTSYAHDKVGLIILEGGVNDALSSVPEPDSFQTEATEVIKLLRNEFTNARIVVINFLGGELDPTHCIALNQRFYRIVVPVNKAVLSLGQPNIMVIPAFNILGHQSTLYNEDKLHPNQTGHLFIAASIRNVILGGSLPLENNISYISPIITASKESTQITRSYFKFRSPTTGLVHIEADILPDSEDEISSDKHTIRIPVGILSGIFRNYGTAYANQIVLTCDDLYGNDKSISTVGDVYYDVQSDGSYKFTYHAFIQNYEFTSTKKIHIKFEIEMSLLGEVQDL